MEKGLLINNSASKATKSGGILSGGSDSTSKYPSSSVADHTRLLNEDLVSNISDGFDTSKTMISDECANTHHFYRI